MLKWQLDDRKKKKEEAFMAHPVVAVVSVTVLHNTCDKDKYQQPTRGLDG